MSTPAQRSARAALDAARPAVARLDATRGSEDLAADLIETWSAVEAALRVLVGSSALSGQALIREARQRQMLNFDQANALAEFEAVHSRLQDTSYRPTEVDVAAARNAYLKLDAALTGDIVEPPRAAPVGTTPIASSGPAATTEPVVVATSSTRGRPRWLIPAAVLALIVIGIAGYFAFVPRGNSSLDQGIAAYKAGQREVAMSAFTKASRDDPKAVMPHVWMARMARDVGNFTLAGQELNTALQIDPNNSSALREMGSNMLQQGNAELARRFYVRAVQNDPSDKTAEGYLGCALMRLNRAQEGTAFLNRAGPGPWSNCTATAAAVQPGQPVQAPRQIPP
ncbi:MAG TPA: tetratricopeptide repeat protein [Gemmatimonadaceae bacterium]|nr:tetratricopeptide repeat protein [Gemmatimonadaceae bacterium]